MNSESSLQHYRNWAWVILTLVVLASCLWNLAHDRDQMLQQAIVEARTIIDEDLADHTWISSHGGVYVPLPETASPNPPTIHPPEAEITTTGGRRLRLLGHSWMTNEGMAESSAGGQIHSRLTSFTPINPDNAPDPWEEQALHGLRQDRSEVYEILEVAGEPWLRLMWPFPMQSHCLKCHGESGVKPGELLGGIGVRMSLQPYFDRAEAGSGRLFAVHMMIWLIGILGISLALRPAMRTFKERLRDEERLRRQERWLHLLLDSTAEGIVAFDPEGRCTMANKACLDLLGYQNLSQVLGKNLHGIVHHKREDGRPYLWQECPAFRAIQEGRSFQSAREILWRTDETPVPVELRAYPVMDGDLILGSVAIMLDLQEREFARQRLELAAQVFEQAEEGLMITDHNGLILDVNQSFSKTTGYSWEEVVGQSPKLLHSGYHDADFYRVMWTQIRDEGYWRGEVWNRRKDGDVYPEYLTISAVKGQDGGVTHYIGLFNDISANIEVQEQLQFLTTRDVLTGLPNRALLSDRVAHAIARAERHRYKLALCFVDLDNFKIVNDTFGHEAGDKLLKLVTRRFLKVLREEDTIARIGGDEFVVVLENTSIRQMAKTSNRLCESLRRPFEIAGQELYVTASIGISLYPDDGTNIQELMKNAETAMYRAKQQGKNTHQFYMEDMNIRAEERIALESGLRRAIENDEMYLVYQPQIDIRSQEVTGAEALVRWRHHDLGEQAPNHFIRLAEEIGLIDSIGDWVLQQVCGRIRSWQEAGIEPLSVAVNLSARQFRRADIASRVRKLLHKNGVQPALLRLELTESALVEDIDHACRTLDDLRALGIKIAIDDFGTGYSSLSYLRRFPIDELKIDKEFIADITTDPGDRAIASTIIALAHGLDMRVVAEGVEHLEQLLWLADEGCDLAQGYYFSHPLMADDFVGWLSQHRRERIDRLIPEALMTD